MLKRNEESEELTRVQGTVEHVTFHSEESGFTVLRIQASGRRDLITVVGSVSHIVAGETLRATGCWVVDKQHGRQFKADLMEMVPPDSLEGIERFLGSGLIKGIGQVYASRLVSAFGKRIFDVIEKESALLEKVAGIGRLRRQRIKQSWVETRQIRSIMAFLMAHGASTARAFRIYKAYGENAIKRVSDDPYCLARDIRGIGFKTADRIAETLGIQKTSDLRARAGVEFVLMEITGEGHCAYPRERLVERAAQVLEIPADIVERAVDFGVGQRRLVQPPRGGGESGPLVYLAALHKAENDLAENLRALADGAHPAPVSDSAKAVEWSEKQVGLTLAPAQREAMKTALESKVTVITGGPGVGKTTLVNAIIKVLAAKKLRIALCAPTGRAAKRMAEATGREAKTIHRLLEYDPVNGGFKRDRGNPLGADVVVVDEFSMVDLLLADQLVRAIKAKAALTIVGDADQLPSVGPGTVLRDIVNSGVFPVCRLTHVFRQAAQSMIITNAHRINAGHMPELRERRDAADNADFFFVEAEDPAQGAELVVRLVCRNIPDRFGFDPMQDIQVLTPMRRGELGAHNLNAALQNALNPRGESIERFACTYRIGDRVMQTENDYEKDVFNGDMGRVCRIDREEREMDVRFDNKVVKYDFEELDEVVPSYAITIHKSQGSEYACVVVPIHTQHYVMLQRNLLYTAVTRGRKLVVLVGTKKALAIAVHRIGAHQRITTLRERLAAGQEWVCEEISTG